MNPQTNVGEESACKLTFYGSATVGERGQIVIPAEARQGLGILPGDKLLIVSHPVHKGLNVFKFEDAKAFLDEVSAMLDSVENGQKEEEQL